VVHVAGLQGRGSFSSFLHAHLLPAANESSLVRYIYSYESGTTYRITHHQQMPTSLVCRIFFWRRLRHMYNTKNVQMTLLMFFFYHSDWFEEWCLNLILIRCGVVSIFFQVHNGIVTCDSYDKIYLKMMVIWLQWIICFRALCMLKIKMLVDLFP
jgi:hypothetical protein